MEFFIVYPLLSTVCRDIVHTHPARLAGEMFLISAFVAGLFLPVVNTCSLPPGTLYYSPVQRTILAPIVFRAKVLNTTTNLDRHATGQVFDACVQIERIFKSPFEIPPELCFGSFGIEELCLTYVFEGFDYVFFVNEDFTARYDGFPVSAIAVSDELVSAVERGYCSADQSDDCGEYIRLYLKTQNLKSNDLLNFPASGKGIFAGDKF